MSECACLGGRCGAISVSTPAISMGFVHVVPPETAAEGTSLHTLLSSAVDPTLPSASPVWEDMAKRCDGCASESVVLGPCLLLDIQRTGFVRSSDRYTKSSAVVALDRVVFATGRRYELSAIAVYQGSAEAGHYLLYRRRGRAGESWTLYNDAAVSVCVASCQRSR